jgi:hypothetical protein
MVHKNLQSVRPRARPTYHTKYFNRIAYWTVYGEGFSVANYTLADALREWQQKFMARQQA